MNAKVYAERVNFKAFALVRCFKDENKGKNTVWNPNDRKMFGNVKK